MVENVDIVIRNYQKFFTHVYSKFSGKHTKPGEKPGMEQDEFIEFCEISEFNNDLYTTREVSVAFNLSMLTQVYELEKMRHLSATPLEFMEMICRGALDASFDLPGVMNEDGEMEYTTHT